MFTVDDAVRLAVRSHHGQADKGDPDLPYVLHPLRVMAQFDDPALRMIAVLHDAVEDSRKNRYPVTRADLEARGVPERVLAGIDSMTHNDDESDEDYWKRLRANPDAVAVKNADIDDNTDPDRLALLDEATRDRLIEKYRQARAAING